MSALDRVRERLSVSLWFIPAVFAAAAILVGLGLLAVDHELAANARDWFFLFAGTAEGARSVLSTIAQSMLTFTGLVFTVTMLVLQQAANQLSPRVIRTFLQDRPNQIVLGLFVATLVYTLVVLLNVRTQATGDDGFVPGLSIWVAFVLLLASVGAFIYYINHMAHAIRATTVLANIAAETRAAIERRFGERTGAPDEIGGARGDGADADAELDRARLRGTVLKADRSGVIVGVDEAGVLEAVGDDRFVEIVPALGEFVPAGAPLARLHGEWDRAAADALRAAITVGRERAVGSDPAFGFRQLVDIALRALSPGVNDPTTAVQALDRIHELLRLLARRRLPVPVRRDDAGIARFAFREPAWADYVHLALDEVRIASASQVQVVRRMRALLLDLASVVADDRRSVVRDELNRLDALVERSFAEPADRALVG